MANVGIAYLRYKVLGRGRLLQGENQTRPRILGLQVSGFLSKAAGVALRQSSQSPASKWGWSRWTRSEALSAMSPKGWKDGMDC